MKLKKGFVLREVCKQKIVTAEGLENINFNKLLSLNDSAAFLWEKAEGKDFTLDDLADALVEEYGIERERALKDCASLVENWRSAGVLDE
ncbi:MAG: PqqD family protein [Bacteroidales bacterium]|nr:PqqD family protein [Bacteroidales bacterium]